MSVLKSNSVRANVRSRITTLRTHKHLVGIPFITTVLLAVATIAGLVTFGGNEVRASDSRSVILSHDDQRVSLPTRAQTVGDLLKSAGVTLHEGDIVEPAQETEILDDNFRVNVYRARPVTVVDGDTKVSALSAATTPRSVAEQSGITVHPEDVITTEMQDNFLSDNAIGEKVVIDRATPTIVNLYGTSLPIRTHAQTVGDVLVEKNITITEGDTVQPAVDTPVSQGLQIFVVRAGTRVETTEVALPMKTEYVEDASLSFGAKAIRQQGTPGKKVVTYQVQLENDREVGRTVVQEVVVSEPVTHIVARGKTVAVSGDKEAIMAAAGIAPSDFAYVNFIISRESGWRVTVANKSSGAYGLCQALPGTKMASAGSDWQTNPVTQLKWCSGYAKSRYGSWAAAYESWQRKHWW